MLIFRIIIDFFIFFFKSVGSLAIFILETVKWTLRKPFRKQVFLEQMEKIGIQTLPVALISSTFTGMIFIVQLYYSLKQYNLESVCPGSLGLSLIRELAPVLAGLVMAGRVGAALTAEIGTMKVTEQIDALTTMGVNPIQYLSSPRFLSTTFAMLGIVIMADFVGILGGMVVGKFVLGLNSTTFISQAFADVTLKDFFASMIKGLTFGMIIAWIGCWKGFYVRGGSKGVGKATMESVVIAMELILLWDYILNLIIW
ncbi:ABC transporter permease [bacterium]|nr:ABC transporter permease [bacterium]